MNLANVKPEIMEQIEGTFTPEQIEKIKAAESLDEVFEIIEDEGIELAAEQLDLVAGGRRQGLADQLLKCVGDEARHSPDIC